jgi:hypothetical protein
MIHLSAESNLRAVGNYTSDDLLEPPGTWPEQPAQSLPSFSPGLFKSRTATGTILLLHALLIAFSLHFQLRWGVHP